MRFYLTMILLLIVSTCSGCAVLPEGSELGWYYRIGYDANKSFAWHWTNTPRDPTWQCPGKGQEGLPPGIPTWMDCK